MEKKEKVVKKVFVEELGVEIPLTPEEFLLEVLKELERTKKLNQKSLR